MKRIRNKFGMPNRIPFAVIRQFELRTQLITNFESNIADQRNRGEAYSPNFLPVLPILNFKF